MRSGFTRLVKVAKVKYQELNYYLHCYTFLSRGVRQKRKHTMYPTIVQIQTVNRCNGQCIMCPYLYTVAQKEKRYLSHENYLKIIKEITTWPVRGLLVLNLQNEPYCDDRIEAFTSIAREYLGNRWLIEITTNGVLLEPGRIKRLAQSPPDILNISVNAFSKRIYERVMPGFSWETVQSNISFLLSNCPPGMKLYLRYIRHAENSNELQRFKTYWNTRGIPVFSYLCNDRSGSLRNFEQLNKGVTPAIKHVVRKFLAQIFFKSCPLLYSQVNITAEGNIVLCCNDYRNESVMGTIYNKNIVSIFNLEGYKNIRKSLSQGKRTRSVCDYCKFHHEGIWLQ